MAVFPGQSVLATGAATVGSAPILTVPAGGSASVVGFAFTNPQPVALQVSVYRDFVGPASAGSGLLFTVTVPALAGQLGGPAALQQAWGLALSPGETLYAVGLQIPGWVNVEIDGISPAVAGGLSMQQLQLAQIFMLHEGLGVDIPDANTLNNGYTFS